MRTLHLIACFSLLGCIDGWRPVFVGDVADSVAGREVDGYTIDLGDSRYILPDSRLIDGSEVTAAVEVVEDVADAAQVEVDVVLACGPGCACDTCDGDCTRSCDGTCGCAIDCRDNDGRCKVGCKGESTCAVDCQGTNDCEVECKGHSQCAIDCRGANNCKPLRCRDDAVCHIDCRGANNCDDLRCDGRARCYLRCDPDDDNCGCRGGTSCGDGVIACNGAPC